MSYLQESLEERPRKQIANLSLDRDFANAIATLKARYDNKRLIYQAYIQEIVEAKPITKTSENELRDLVDVVESSLRALKKLATQKEIFEGMLLHIARLKLDSRSRSKWEDEIPAGTYPTWDEFVSFIERRCRSLETKNASSSGALSNVSDKVGNSMKGIKPQHRKSFIVSKVDSTCWFCKTAQHRIEECDAFRKLSPSDRFHKIKAMKRCILCLQPGHSVKHCNLSSCQECNNKHHTLLHFEKLHSPVNQSANTVPSSASTQTGLVMTSYSECAQRPESALLATAIVLVKSSQGDYIPCRAVLDAGSTINLIAERLVQHLRLKKTKLEFQIDGVGYISLASKYKTDVSIKSRVNGYTAHLEAYVLRNITGLLPSQSVPTTNWRIPSNITLADPKYNTPQSIDLLIGAGLFFELLSVGQIKLGKGLPILQKTVLGWIVAGGKGSEGNVCHVSLTNSSDETIKLEALVQRFWSIDNFEIKGKLLSPEQQACEEHFVKNTKRDELGRFSVELPFRKIPDNLGTSLDIAKKRFFNLEHKLAKSPQLKSQYYEFILEYATLGHMEMVPFQEIPRNHYFMPHHCAL